MQAFENAEDPFVVLGSDPNAVVTDGKAPVRTIPHSGNMYCRGLVILAKLQGVKLQWAARSNSEKQWRDVLGVMKVQGDHLDRSVLIHWAKAIGLEEDVDRALQASGLEPI